MNLLSNFNLNWSWPQVFALILLALVGAFLAERVVGNAPKYGILGSLVLGILGAWFFSNLPLEIQIEPRLEDMPVVRSVLGGLVLVAIFAYLRKQGAPR
ncbi:MAG: hypothetical protein JWP00_2940 [Chloroflexi bacterium]|jgi:uncharacterized membrane protein YeaQ/YmgE (transglycosylase-associated protein family)|nr:hypothetical protein [Chloroflexota bacterium]